MNKGFLYKIGDAVCFSYELNIKNPVESFMSFVIGVLKESFEEPFFVHSIYPRRVRIGICDCFTNEPLRTEMHKLRCGKFMSLQAVEIKTRDGEIVNWNGQTYFSNSFLRPASFLQKKP